jgi:ABC-2 type transport system ATP-binding protein
VDNLSIRVQPGDVYGFLGPNGAGKTTAIRMILGLIRPDIGQVQIFGEGHRVRRLRGVGSMVEMPAFFDGMTGRDNLVRALAYADSIRPGSVDQSLERVGLLERADEKVKTYSLGMRQRLGIARALLGEPRLLVLDEPTNGLDPRGMKEIRDLLASLARDESLTILISSHLLSEVEQLCNRVGILDKGRMVAEGTQSELNAMLGKGDPEVELRGPDLDGLRATLGQLEGVELLESTHVQRLRVRLKGMQIWELNQRLVAAGQDIDTLLPIEGSLEESFLGLTEETL